MQLIAAHGLRDLASAQLDPERLPERAAGAQHALRMRTDPAPRARFRAAIRRMALDPGMQRPIVGRVGSDPADRGGHQQVALDVTERPDEELETRLEHADGGLIVGMVVAIEHDEPGQPRRGTAPPAEIIDRPRRLPPAEDHRTALEGRTEDGRDMASPAGQNLPVARALEVEDEGLRVGATLRSRRRGTIAVRSIPGTASLRISAEHARASIRQAMDGRGGTYNDAPPLSPSPIGPIDGTDASLYPAPMISIVIADDHGIVREGLRRLLESEPDFKVSGEAADGREVLERVASLRPDVVVLDITMPRLGGLETLERLRSDYPGTKVILLSVHSDANFIQSAISLGADGYILKNGRAAEIVTAVRETLKGGSYFSPAVAREIVERLRSPLPAPDDPFSLLSGREREILHLIAEGLSAKEVAVQLDVSTKTVEAHRTSLMRKLGVRKATELVRYALRHGLIEP